MNVTPDRPAMPGASGENRPNRNVRVFYDRNHVKVTDQWIDVWETRYPIVELHNIRVMHAQHSDLTINASLIAVAVMIAIARLWDRLGVSGWIGALTVLAVPVLLALVGTQLRRRSHVLIAEFRTLTTVILSDENRLRFNQIARAVRRAQEAQRG